jgi:hypothetical protein
MELLGLFVSSSGLSLVLRAAVTTLEEQGLLERRLADRLRRWGVPALNVATLMLMRRQSRTEIERRLTRLEKRLTT